MLGQERGECAALGIKLKALVVGVEQQASVLQGEQGADPGRAARGDRWQGKLQVPFLVQAMQAAARDKPQPASRVPSNAADKRVDAPDRGGAAPGERGVAREAIGGRQPEGPARLDCQVVELAAGAFFALDHLPFARFPFEEGVNGRRPISFIRAAPGKPGLFDGDHLG